MKVRVVSVNEISDVSTLHARIFKTNLMTLLGRNFLQRYYQMFNGTIGQVFVLEVEGEVVGFASVIIKPNKFYTAFRKKRIAFLFSAFTSLIMHPQVMLLLLKSIPRISRSTRKEYNGVEISSIGVLPNEFGYGSFLLAGVVNRLYDSEIYLRTDSSNKKNCKFYQKNGFSLIAIENDQYRPMNVYSFKRG